MTEELSVSALLQRLQPEEKLTLLAGNGLWKTRAIPGVSVPPMKLVDGPRGVGFHSTLRRCTAFPTGIALGASWDAELAQEFGVALARETIAVGANVVLGPAVNICRTPVNGRTFEYFTEDPFLNSRLAVPTIRGIQSQGVAACIKHYAANNQEAFRMKTSAEVSERALREIYLPVFEAAIREADVWSVMAAYNAVNGIAACESRNLLHTRLREEYGFSGFVVSDWFATRRTQSGASCMKAGLNLEMPGKGNKYRPENLQREFKEGAFTESQLDDCLAPLLRVWLRTTSDNQAKPAINTREHQQLAYRMAAESITLLKNSNDALPLKGSIKRIAVLGPRANRRNCLPLYGGSAGVWSPYEITPLKGLRESMPAGCKIVRNPAKADVAIVFVGLGHRLGGDSEVKDRPDMRLPEEQEQLIRKTAAANPNTIVVLVSGSPVEMEWADQVRAVVAAWYPGMEGGRAIADVLFGRVNPSGKLPVTFPRSLADSPAHASQRQYPGDGQLVHYDEGVFIGYRHFDHAGLDVLFPFGHGLSYTSFGYEDLKMPTAWHRGKELEVSVTIKNCGPVAGAEVVQLYVSPPANDVVRPPRELKDFRKIYLEAGESRTIEFSLTNRALAYWREATDDWHVDDGTYQLCLGSSSRDIRLSGTVEFTSNQLVADSP